MRWLDFFIERPITASIINLTLVFAGVLAFKGLLLDEYPRIVVPRVKVQTTYHNASAKTVEKEITDPIEEAMSRVEGVESIASTSSNGVSEVRLKFLPSVPMDRAVMQVSEQLSRIASLLPDAADAPSIKRSGSEGDAFIYLGVTSKELSGAALTHLAHTQIKNHFQGIEGVSAVEVYGAPYVMNITLDTLAMHSLRVGPHQVVKVLKDHELLLQAGRMRSKEPISLDVVAKEPEDYARMIVSMNGDVPVHLGDIARIELIDDDKEQKIRVDGQNAILLPITKGPDGNNLAVADAIYTMVDTVNQELRGRAVVSIESDHSVFVRASLQTIFRTIIEACVLVILIIFLFLRHVRATLIPLVTIPISLIATFFALKIFGLSINTITLLAMVLAVGLVVDDAIVVLENIFRFREQGLSALEAAKKGTQEIGFAIVAMTITLMSVFLPLAFVTDITGTILREFAVTLAASVLFSGLVALTLSPMMCAYLLKHEPKENKFGLAIERVLQRIEALYHHALQKAFATRRAIFIAMLVMLGGGLLLYQRLHADLLPKEDRGIIGAFIPSVPGFELDDMEPYVAQVEQIFLRHQGIKRMITIGFDEGFQVVAVLKPWAERSEHAEKIVAHIRQEVASISTANVYPWSWDSGLDALKDDSNENAEVVLALKSSGSYEDLDKVARELVDAMRKDGIVVDARSDLDINEKAYSIKLLKEPLAYLGIDEKMVSMALQTYANRARASEFKLEGQRYKVYLEPDSITDDLNAIYINTKVGDPVPLSAVAKVKPEVEAPALKHLNKMRVAHVLASLNKGQSLSEAKEYLDQLVAQRVPAHISVSYQGNIAMQKSSSATFLLLFFAGLIFIFAIMAIQFESLIDPLIILLTVPFACVGGIVVLWLSGSNTNLYTQVGLLTLIGLITKHGILLTEFVGQKRQEGILLKDAVFMAARLRFRPIIMTTAATVLGTLPLVLSRGAGVEARSSIGLVIIGGMMVGTILTLFVLPGAIYSVHSLKDRLLTKK